MVEGVVVHDVTGAITTVNRAAERILGLSHDQLRGRTSIDPRWRTIHVDGTPFPGSDHPAMRALSSGQSQLDVTMGVHKATGELSWISINAIPLMETGAKKPSAVAVTFHDISEKRAAELARERLTQQQRLITTGTLASGVGHEINNPLAYLLANLEVALEEIRALEGGSPSDRIKSIVDALGDAKEGAERIRRIVRGLRSLAREDTVPLPTNVQQVVATSLDMAMHELRHRASIEVGDFDVPLVSADESRLAQMLVNLLVNAGQAFALADPERNKVSVMATRRGDVVSIAVTDNGPGIAPQVLSRIFDPFFTTKPVGQGTGLGLSICHSIATSLGGAITCKTEVGRGTTFEILLPVAREAQVPAAPAVVSATGGGTILALDDEDGMLRSLVRALSTEYEVVTCSDAREAWRRLEGGERFDVIFCDLAMPHLSGFEVLRRLRQLDAEQAARLVFISGGIVGASAFDAEEIASVELLEKPFTVQALRGIARRYVSRSRLPGLSQLL
jgi:PAS domain S-box-containing protein